MFNDLLRLIIFFRLFGSTGERLDAIRTLPVPLASPGFGFLLGRL